MLPYVCILSKLQLLDLSSQSSLWTERCCLSEINVPQSFRRTCTNFVRPTKTACRKTSNEKEKLISNFDPYTLFFIVVWEYLQGSTPSVCTRRETIYSTNNSYQYNIWKYTCKQNSKDLCHNVKKTTTNT